MLTGSTTPERDITTMAKNADTTTVETPTPTFTTAPLTALPKRQPPVREVDLTLAKAIMAITSVPTTVEGALVAQTVSDGALYPERKLARAEASKHSRALARVLPEGQYSKSRVYADGDGFRWAVWQDATPPAPKGAAKA